MKKIIFFALIIGFVSCKTEKTYQDLAQYVDPFIGTGGHGHTYPGASLPFGMVQLSPDSRLTGWDGCSAYHYSDSVIYGFSHTHLSGTGVSDYGDILLMPTSGDVKINNGSKAGVSNGYASNFSHENETAEPGYYQVFLEDYKINAELTATTRTGFHKYTYSDENQKNVIIDLKHRDKVIKSGITKVNDYELEGYRVSEAWASEQYIYFVVRFSEKIDQFSLFLNDSLLNKLYTEGTNVKCAIRFSDHSNKTVYAKVGISAVDIQGARNNLAKELKGWRFEKVRQQARNEWNKRLNKIQVETPNEANKTIYYTALYHSLLNPNVFMDNDGRYRGTDLKIHEASDFTNHTIFSLWDTYRATHPLLTIIEQEKTRDFLNTFIQHYKNGGQLPVWELAGNYTGCMIGYHSIPVIADAFLKGIDGVDYETLFEAMKHSAEQNHLGLEEYRKYGYIPADMEPESVSKTLEYAYDDWCIAQVAKKLGKQKEYDVYLKRAQSYKNIFDQSTGFMRPKMNSGWIVPFDPKEVTFHFTEANSWQYSFYVPQDVKGLIQLHGNDEKFSAKLDALFSEQTETTGRHQADITGLVGQYAHGNEPSHHMAYLYTYAGKAWKTQEMVHQLMDEMYSCQPDGLCGNEDCGQMSSWYNFSALGFYPVNPADGIYVIGSPLFEKASINTENGKSFNIISHNLTKENIYIDSVKLNGKSHPYAFITHSDIMNGGTLEFYMGNQPNKDYAINEEYRPVSVIKEHQITPVPVIHTKGRTFYSSMYVRIKSVDENSKIYYTIDGTVPTSSSKEYSEAFYLYESAEIKAVSIKEGVKSNVVSAEFKKIPWGRTISIKSEYSSQYTAGGDNGIIDYLRGPHDFRTGFWQGYQGHDFEAVVNLGRTQRINYVAGGFLQEIRSWIFMPREVEFLISKDGQNFTSVGIIKNTVPEDDYTQQVKDFSLKIDNKLAKYVKVKAKYLGKIPEWHLAAGYEAWIFIDEIIIE